MGVRLDDGTVIRSKLVVSDASAYTTFMDSAPRGVERHGYPQVRRARAQSGSPLRLGYDEAIDLPAHIFWHLPDYDITAADKRYKDKLDFENGQCCTSSARPHAIPTKRSATPTSPRSSR